MPIWRSQNWKKPARHKILTRTIKKVLDEDTMRMESGGVLATIGATAPFVGLFGTVWGVSRLAGHWCYRCGHARQGGRPSG